MLHNNWILLKLKNKCVFLIYIIENYLITVMIGIYAISILTNSVSVIVVVIYQLLKGKKVFIFVNQNNNCYIY